MTDIVPEAFPEGLVPARVVASRSVLVQIQRSQPEDPSGLLLVPAFTAKTETGASLGLVPRIDAGLDSAHRFAKLGAVFRPMRQFLRRTFDGSDDNELSSDLGGGDSASVDQD